MIDQPPRLHSTPPTEHRGRWLGQLKVARRSAVARVMCGATAMVLQADQLVGGCRARLILFSLSVDGEVRIWDLTNPSASTLLLQTLTPESHAADRVSAISFNERSNCLVTADKKLGLWFYRTRYDPVEVHAARAIAPKGHSNPLVGVLYSEHFYLIVSGDVAGLICVWDVGEWTS